MSFSLQMRQRRVGESIIPSTTKIVYNNDKVPFLFHISSSRHDKMSHFCGGNLQKHDILWKIQNDKEMGKRNKNGTKCYRVGLRIYPERPKSVKKVKKLSKYSLFVAENVPFLWRFPKNATKLFRKRSFFVATSPRNCSDNVPNLWRKSSFFVAYIIIKCF